MLSRILVFILTYLFEQTLGKMIMGIKVIPVTNKKISWDEALLREIIGKFLSMSFIIRRNDINCSRSNKQSLHDKLGNMYVVWDKND
ncbi:RDD family protein [Paenibacillus sp. S-12]|uniref:RDD family protein n=1 Tax=Paenibacillus sp. S-12 TaxID=3031371 RepID=UPI00338EADB9